jgi:transcription antitermination factor NusG
MEKNQLLSTLESRILIKFFEFCNRLKYYNKGDSIRITSGALVGNESRILKINKNRHEAVIGVAMFGTIAPVSVGLDIVEKIGD